MSHNNGIITPPVNIEGDLGYVLGTGSGDVGTNCVSTNINPWAIYKPIVHSGHLPFSRAYISDLGFGTAGNMNNGLNYSSRTAGIPYATSVQGILNMYNDSAILRGKPANGWRYFKPRGKTYNEFYRVFDFCRCSGNYVQPGNGYNHSAPNPFGRFTCSERLVRAGGRYTASNERNLLANTDQPDTDIVIGEFNQYLANSEKMLYYGVLLVPSDSSYAYKLIGNHETKITDGMLYRGHETMSLEDFYLSASSFAKIPYTAYPVLSNQQFPSTNLITVNQADVANDLGQRFYSLPGSEPVVVDIYDDQIAINVFTTVGQTVTSGYNTTVYFTIKNYYNYSITIDSLMMKVRLPSRSYIDGLAAGEIWYDKTYSYDTSHPSGQVHGDSSITYLLSPITLASGEEKRVPSGSLTTSLSVSNIDTTRIYIGCTYNGSQHYGYSEVTVPGAGNRELP